MTTLQSVWLEWKSIIKVLSAASTPQFSATSLPNRFLLCKHFAARFLCTLCLPKPKFQVKQTLFSKWKKGSTKSRRCPSFFFFQRHSDIPNHCKTSGSCIPNRYRGKNAICIMLLCFFSPPSVIPLSPNPGHLCSTSCSKGERHVPPEELWGRTRVLLTHKVANMRKDAFFIKGWMLPHARACVQPEGYKTNPTSVPQQQSSSAEVLVLEGWGLKAVSSVSPL